MKDRLRYNLELFSDKNSNPLTRTEFIKHGDDETGEWLDEKLNRMNTDLSGAAQKSYVNEELAKKAKQSDLEITEAKAESASESVAGLETKTDSLQAQIDALVIEGGGDSNPEVVQARVDSAGVTHTTLKERIDSNVTDLKSDLSGLKRDVGKIYYKVSEQLPSNAQKTISVDLKANTIYKLTNNTPSLVDVSFVNKSGDIVKQTRMTPNSTEEQTLSSNAVAIGTYTYGEGGSFTLEDITTVIYNIDNIINSIEGNLNSIEDELNNLYYKAKKDLDGGTSNFVKFQLKSGVEYRVTNETSGYISLASYNESLDQIENFGNIIANTVTTITPEKNAPILVVYAYESGKFEIENPNSEISVIESNIDKNKKAILDINNGFESELTGGTTTTFSIVLDAGKEYVVNNKINNYISLASYTESLELIENFGNVAANTTTTITPEKNACLLNIYAYGDGNVSVNDKDSIVYNLNEKINAGENSAYSVKDYTKNIVVVDCNGSGNFTTISDAFNSISDSSANNEYEVVVYPGVYKEINLIPPKYTHTHGLQPNTVIVTSEGFDGSLPVFDQQESTKLSNMKIVSHTGYCIHYDVALDGKTIHNTNLHLKKVLYEGQNPSIIGGGSFKNGTLFVWDNCIFENGYVACHTNYRDYANTHLVFKNCKFIDAPMDIANTGGFGNHVCELIGNTFQNLKVSLRSHVTPFRYLESDANKLFANQMEWQFIGSNNKNFVPSVNFDGEGLLYSTKNNGDDIELSGSALPYIFGYVEYKKGFSRATGKAYGCYLVKDEQAGYTTKADVYQLWKRLGDCSSENKTLTVKVNGITQTYTFNKNYLNSKDNESSIIASVNNVITVATLSKYIENRCWSNFVLDDVNMIIVENETGVLKDEYIDIYGYVCESDSADVLGLVLEDCAKGEIVRVWSGNALIR